MKLAAKSMKRWQFPYYVLSDTPVELLDILPLFLDWSHVFFSKENLIITKRLKSILKQNHVSIFPKG